MSSPQSRARAEDAQSQRIRVEDPKHQRIWVGVGGWTYEPWRGGNFFPAELPHSRELHYASRHVSAIEVNGTYYSTFTAKTFAKWRSEAPPGFVFSLKANRFATNRRVLADAGESIARFCESGITELGDMLGPIVWQFAPTKRFEPDDFEAFLAQLPDAIDGTALRHVVDVRNDSFKDPAFLQMARDYRVATVFADSDEFPSFADRTADFTYARLLKAEADVPPGDRPAAHRRRAQPARDWAAGTPPEGLPRVEPAPKAEPVGDVFVFFINGAKERAPAAAQALLTELGWQPPAG